MCRVFLGVGIYCSGSCFKKNTFLLNFWISGFVKKLWMDHMSSLINMLECRIFIFPCQ